jgi:hypothetical protein
MRTMDNNESDFDEVRVISLPPHQTAAVNRLLREEAGWSLLEVRVVEKTTDDGSDVWRPQSIVIYVLGHRVSDAAAE